MIAVLAFLSLAFAASSWGVALRARRLARQRRRLAEDVGLLQAALLPVVPEWVGPLRASVAYRPAEGPAAGGDFYDVFTLEDGRVAVIVGDVSGHGRTALPQTALIRYTLRAYLDSGLAPRTALRAAGAALEHQLGNDCYATVALATYDAEQRALTYACAGHPPPVVLGARPLEPVLASASPPIGLGYPTGRRQTTVRLAGAARVCLFTDGVIEARTDAGELYGSERLAEAIRALGSEATAENLLQHVAAHTERRPDDMAACMLALDGPQASTMTRTEELEVDAAELDGQRPARFLAACGIDADHAERTLARTRAAIEPGGAALITVELGRAGRRVTVEARPIELTRGGGAWAGASHHGSPLVS